MLRGILMNKAARLKTEPEAEQTINYVNSHRYDQNNYLYAPHLNLSIKSSEVLIHGIT
jgi:hypothetical protein